MSEEFDPYHKWLGIAPNEQPAHHYRLLGIPVFETDPDVIEAAADRLMSQLRTYQGGKHGRLSQRVLNEVAAARVCLLDHRKRGPYDTELRTRLAALTPVVTDNDAVDLTQLGLDAAAVSSLSSKKLRVHVPPEPSLADADQFEEAVAGLNPRLLLAVVGGSGVLVVLLIVGLWAAFAGGSRTTPRPQLAVNAVTSSSTVVKGESVGNEPRPPRNGRDDAQSHAGGAQPTAAVDGAPIPKADEPPAAAEAESPPAAQPTPIVKQPPPTGEELARLKARVAELFKDSYQQATTPAEKAAVAKQMVSQATQADVEPGLRYALLTIAGSGARQCGDSETMLAAIDRLAESHTIDVLQERLTAIRAMAEKERPGTAWRPLAEAASAGVEAALAADRPAAAREFAELTKLGVDRAGDRDLADQMRLRLTELAALATFLAAVEQSQATLAQTPTDAAANAVLGRYVCFVRGDWQRGLPLLAQGNDAALKAAAEEELRDPQESQQQVALGAAWAQAAAHETVAARQQLRDRAVYWYFEAALRLSGPERSEIESRLEKLQLGDRRTPLRIINPTDGSVLALIPAGEFLAGGPRLDEGDGPPFPVTLPSYYIGLCEVTNAQYKKFMDATGRRAPDPGRWYKPLVWQGREFDPPYAEHPVAGVSWNDAQAYCKWAGVRLPTELEWEKAARGTDGREFPWGNKWDATRSVNGGVRELYTAAPVYSHPAGRSPFGLYHTAGNVPEWCQDVWMPEVITRMRSGDMSKGPIIEGQRATRGSAWHLKRDHYLAHRRNLGPNDTKLGMGFRVAKDAD